MKIHEKVDAILGTNDDGMVLTLIQQWSGMENVTELSEADRLKAFQMVWGSIGDTLTGIFEDAAYVHYWEASSYNEGFYVGQYFYVDDYNSAEEFNEDRDRWLKAICMTGAVLNLDSIYGDEWLLGDTCGIPSAVSPSVYDFDSEAYYEFKDYADRLGGDDVLLAGLELGFELEEIEERCVFHYNGASRDAMREYAEELVEDGCFGDIPDNLKGYIDYEAIARDLHVDHMEQDGFIFHSC